MNVSVPSHNGMLALHTFGLLLLELVAGCLAAAFFESGTEILELL